VGSRRGAFVDLIDLALGIAEFRTGVLRALDDDFFADDVAGFLAIDLLLL
jgi:hypothetical protein